MQRKMPEILTDNEFEEIATKEYNKVIQANRKSGYSDGIEAGRQSVFQTGFDVGYEQGFRNAFTIGKQQGIIYAHQTGTDPPKSTITGTNDLLLNKPTRGQCQICQDQSLINETIPTITTLQTNHAKNVESALHNKYSDINASLSSN